MPGDLTILLLGGLLSGVLAGILGIGGGSVLVPLMVAVGFTPINAIGTSSLAILLTSVSGSIQNWRMGYLDWGRIGSLGVPAVLATQIGAALAPSIPAAWLLFGFGALMLTNIYLVDLKQRLIDSQSEVTTTKNKLFSSILTGILAGLVAGLAGVGGGAIMVPLQMMLLGETIKVAIQNSLGVVVLTAASATIGHSINHHVAYSQGLILGIGGLLGAQLGTRYLPKLPDIIVSRLFRLTLFLVAIYSFIRGISAIEI